MESVIHCLCVFSLIPVTESEPELSSACPDRIEANKEGRTGGGEGSFLMRTARFQFFVNIVPAMVPLSKMQETCPACADAARVNICVVPNITLTSLCYMEKAIDKINT